MHNYTIPNRYVHQTRMGNWYEEQALQEHHFKDYLKNKEQGNITSTSNQAKIEYSLQPRTLSKSKDGILHYGHSISLLSIKTQGELCYNLYQKLEDQAYAVTTGKSKGPCLRNVFTIEHATKAEHTGPVNYNDQFRLISIIKEGVKVYLQSSLVSPTHTSKFSGYQQVSITEDKNPNSIWALENIDAKLRFETKGVNVRLADEVLLKHIMTGQWLASDNITYLNDFGKQYEVFCKSLLIPFKTQNLYAEKTGHVSVEVPLRDQQQQNHWRIL